MGQKKEGAEKDRRTDHKTICMEKRGYHRLLIRAQNKYCLQINTVRGCIDDFVRDTD